MFTIAIWNKALFIQRMIADIILSRIFIRYWKP